MSAGQPSHPVDLTQLPDDVAALIEALRPGEELVITRAGTPIATISSTGGALEGDIVMPEKPNTDQPEPANETVTVVATAMKLPEQALASLSAELGPDYIVVDMHAAPPTTDVLLIPPSSPQLIGHVRAMFPAARIIVTEIEDDEFGISYRGPLGRMLDAGAETYLPSATIPSLAKQLDVAVTHRSEIGAGSAVRHEIELSADPNPPESTKD
jgi:antitoxin (DNA-binding transcriptional repressor) of toxin-antitoxin stability system